MIHIYIQFQKMFISQFQYNKSINMNLQNDFTQLYQQPNYLFNKDDLFVQVSQQEFKLKPASENIIFEFPTKLLKQQSLLNNDHFRALLRQEELDHPQYGKLFTTYKKENSLGSFVFVRCRQCKVFIKYKKNEDESWKLLSYDNMHTHKQHKVKKTIRNYNDRKVFQSLYIQKQKKQPSNYPISQSQFYKSKKYLQKMYNFQLVNQILKALKYKFKYHHHPDNEFQKGYPDFIVIISEVNRINFAKYGEIIYFDHIINIKFTQESFEKKTYNLGIFRGFDNRNSMVIFGMVIFIEVVGILEKILNEFFKLLNSPSKNRTIVVKYELLKCQQHTNFNFILNYPDFVDIVRNRLETQSIPKSYQYIILKQIKTIIKTPSIQAAQIQLNYLRQIFLKNNFSMGIYNFLYDNKQKICFWAIADNNFYGIKLYSTKSILNSLGFQLASPTNFEQCIKNFNNNFNKQQPKKRIIIKYEKYPFEKLYKDKNIRKVRKNVQKTIFSVFLTNYIDSFQFRSTDSHLDSTVLINFINSEKYEINNKEFCSCKYKQKTGIPCSHLIFIMKELKINYLKLFDKRWLISQIIKQQQQNEQNRKRSQSRKL